MAEIDWADIPTSTCDIEGVTVVQLPKHLDSRGQLMEMYSENWFEQVFGVRKTFVQDNIVSSRALTLRGLHYQNPHPQGKFLFVIYGAIKDVVVDLRVGSPTFGKHATFHMYSDCAIWIPEGLAHGFISYSESLVLYKMTHPRDIRAERCLQWNDRHLGIDWGIRHPDTPMLSNRDQFAMSFKECCADLGVE